MEAVLTSSLHTLLQWLSVPQVGLGAVFLVALVSATLLPMGSEPVVFGLVQWQPGLFWPAVLVATAGNTLGGAITWWMGSAARRAADHWRATHGPLAAQARAPSAELPSACAQPAGRRALAWLQRHGPAACLLTWLPVVGDPLCAVAGWLRLPFWPCLLYMALGKFARYASITAFLLHVS